MAYKQSIRDEAFVLYCQGLSRAKISAHFKGRPTEKCIQDWMERYDWRQKRRLVRLETARKLLENVSDLNVLHFRRLQDLIEELTKRLPLAETKSAEGVVRAINEIIKTQRLIAGEPTGREHIEGLPKVIEVHVQQEAVEDRGQQVDSEPAPGPGPDMAE